MGPAIMSRAAKRGVASGRLLSVCYSECLLCSIAVVCYIIVGGCWSIMRSSTVCSLLHNQGRQKVESSGVASLPLQRHSITS